MIEKPPQSPAISELGGLITWAWVIGMSLLGGFVPFLRKVKLGHARAWNFTEFVGELMTAALAGIITYHLCTWRDLPPQLTAALVGIGAHMGSRALFKLEAFFDAKSPATSPKDPDHEA